LHASRYGKWCPVSRGDYVFAGGDPQSDYATLGAAARGLNGAVVVVARRSKEPPGIASLGNMKTVPGLPPDEFNRMMAGAAAVVTPLGSGTLETGGRTVYGNAMPMGKAVIAADDDAGDYITNEHDGLLVPPGEPIALHDASSGALRFGTLCSPGTER
jgi:hypothetical protein